MNKGYEVRSNKEQAVMEARPDAIDNAQRVIGLLDEHPEIGVTVGGVSIAGGITAVIYYGSKLLKAGRA